MRKRFVLIFMTLALASAGHPQAKTQIGARMSEVVTILERGWRPTTWYHTSSVFQDAAGEQLAKMAYVGATDNLLFNLTITEYRLDTITDAELKKEVVDQYGRKLPKGDFEGVPLAEETYTSGTPQQRKTQYHLILRQGRRIIHMNVDVRKNGTTPFAQLMDSQRKILNYWARESLDLLKSMPYGEPSHANLLRSLMSLIVLGECTHDPEKQARGTCASQDEWSSHRVARCEWIS